MTKSKPNDTPLRVLYEKIHVVFAVTTMIFLLFLFFLGVVERRGRGTRLASSQLCLGLRQVRLDVAVAADPSVAYFSPTHMCPSTFRI